jgi:hypothetical protein
VNASTKQVSASTRRFVTVCMSRRDKLFNSGDLDMLALKECAVGPIHSLHELIMRALFQHLQHTDVVGISDGGETVRNDDGGAPVHELFECLLHQVLAPCRIQRTGRFLQRVVVGKRRSAVVRFCGWQLLICCRSACSACLLVACVCVRPRAWNARHCCWAAGSAQRVPGGTWVGSWMGIEVLTSEMWWWMGTVGHGTGQ